MAEDLELEFQETQGQSVKPVTQLNSSSKGFFVIFTVNIEIQ